FVRVTVLLRLFSLRVVRRRRALQGARKVRRGRARILREARRQVLGVQGQRPRGVRQTPQDFTEGRHLLPSASPPRRTSAQSRRLRRDDQVSLGSDQSSRSRVLQGTTGAA